MNVAYTVKTMDVESGESIEVPMSEDQVNAVDTILDGPERIYRLCGGAGVGKSAVIRTLARELDAKVCATTARAALHIHGCTVDSLFGFKRGSWKVNLSRQDYVMRQLGSWIIIDESSMIGHRMAECIYDALDHHNKRVILVGDWAQAPPVKELWPLDSPLLTEGETLTLQTNHRQGEGEYMEVLQKLRRGIIEPRARELFIDRVSPCPQDDEYTYLYGTNRAATAHNSIRLRKHAEQMKMQPIEVKAEFWSKYDMEDERRETIMEHSRMCHRESFCYMAKVMLTLNTYDRGFVNGDIGRLISVFSSRYPVADDVVQLEEAALNGWSNDKQVACQTHGDPACEFVVGFMVELDRNGRRVFVTVQDEEVVNALGEAQYRVTGFPIRLAWAMTVHKAQGATLDRAYLATNTLWTEHGLMYVGLSRTRTIDGLLLEAWRPDLVVCDGDIKPYI